MTMIEQLLGGPVLQPRPMPTGPASPFNIMPRHLNIPNVGGSVPLGGVPIPNYSTTPVNFPTYNPVAQATTPRFGTLGARVAPVASSARRAVSSSPLARIGRVARGGSRLGKIGPAAIAGLLASPVGSAIGGQGEDTKGFDRRDVGQTVSGALTGGALGAVGGWPGMLAGGLIGGVGNALNVFDVFGGGGNEDELAASTPEDISKSLNKTMVELGLPKETRDAIAETTMAQLELAATPAEQQAIMQNAAAVMQQQALAKEESVNQLAHSLALQAQTARVFEPYAEANQRNADMARVLFESAGQDLPPNQRYLAAQFALGAQQQSDALSQQMYTSMLAQPKIDALVAQQQQIESVAAQLVQQAMAGAMSGGGQAGGVDVAALLAQAGA